MVQEIVGSAVDALKDIITPIGETVFEAYMRQVMYEGYMYSLMAIVFLLGLNIGIYKMYVWWKHKDFYDDENRTVVAIVGTLIFVFFNLVGIERLIYHVGQILNPEYYVIQSILNSMGL